MAFSTFNPSIPPSPKTSRLDRTYRVKTMKFGDGYSQRSVDGVNTFVQSGTLGWDVLTQAEMLVILGFFDALEGVTPFYWTPFGGEDPLKWCLDPETPKPIQFMPLNQTTFSLKVNIQQVFDNDV